MRCVPRSSRAFSVVAVALSLAACNGNSGLSPTPGSPAANQSHTLNLPAQRLHRHTSSNPIQHVIIIVQENRSFNNLFMGYKGAKTSKYGYDSFGNKIKLQPIGLETSWDIDHSSNSYFEACNGTGSIPGTDCRMNGFNREYYSCGHRYQPKCPNSNPPYSYVPRSEIGPYWQMAKQYVLADEMYQSNFDSSSFISHQYIISGQAEHAVDYPNNYWGCPGGGGDKINEVGPDRQIPYGSEVVCWDPQTLGDELDNAGLPWAFYTSSYYGDGGIWSAYQAINHIYNGPDWSQDVITPQTKFFSDVNGGKLRTVSWITPTCANSDHAGCGNKTGPSWVASIVNAIGESQYWNSTAIFVFWDDYGGWYDSEPPAYVDYDGLGMRLPLLVISAYAKKHFVSHVHYEHGSILRFVEDTFGLGQLSDSDTRATSPAADCFDFSGPPRRFKQIKSPFDKSYFLHQAVDRRRPDWE
jgi:phospholipase C